MRHLLAQILVGVRLPQIELRQPFGAQFHHEGDDGAGIEGEPEVSEIGPTFGESVANSALVAIIVFSVVIMGFGIEQPSTTVSAVSDCAISDAEAGRACTDADPINLTREGFAAA